METVVWDGMEMTTIGAIALYYTDGDTKLAKEIKPFIRTGISKLETLKLTKDEIKEKHDLFMGLLPRSIPTAGVTLISVEDVPKLEKYFMLVLKQKSKGTYKKDRFFSGRSLVDEFKLEIKRKDYILEPLEFSAVLSFASRLEIGQPQKEALKAASQKFDVTQKRIKDIVEDLEIQIDYKNKPKDYV